MAAAFSELAAIALRNSRTLDALHESEKRYRLLAENASDYIVRVGRDGTLLFVPESSRRFMGYAPDEVLDTKIYAHAHPDDREKVVALLDTLLQEGEEARVEYRAQLREGSYKWVEATGRLIHDTATGEPEVIAVARDIAERKRIEEERERYAAELRRSNEELQQFAYVISHDLREPLRMVKGYMDLLAGRYADQLDEKAGEYIAYAVDGAERMQDMIQALLRLSRVQTRGEAFAPTDVEAALARAQRVLGRAIAEAGAEVTHDPLPTVLADEAQLIQVLQNLVANGIKFRRKDASPHVHVSARRQADTWTLSVTDNGIGIDPDQTDRLFQIFQRLHTREAYPGTGIGLALCRRIVARHGGRIWVESEPGVGSTFYFTLPDVSSGDRHL
jgi:PAS domain S-box-containing protein